MIAQPSGPSGRALAGSTADGSQGLYRRAAPGYCPAMHPRRAPVLALTLGLATLFAASSVHADAVMSPPADCPPGAVGATSHNGPWCRPTTCTSDADCVGVDRRFDGQAPARVCREQPLCIETRSEPSHSGWSHGKPFERIFAHGVCPAGTTCTAPASCETAKRCVVPATPPEPATPTPEPTPEPAPTPAPPSTEAPPAASASRCDVVRLAQPADALWLLALPVLARRRRRVIA